MVADRYNIPLFEEIAVQQKQDAATHSGKKAARGTWASQLDFIFSVIACCVGLGNVWRFPYMAYRNGGGAFLIPYWTVAILIGLPLLILEMGLGQFSNLGPSACWAVCPIFQGVGYASVLMLAVKNVYYAVIVAWSLFYFVVSFTTELPWQSCGHEWNTQLCDLLMVNCTTSATPSWENLTLTTQDGACYGTLAPNEPILLGIVNRTAAAEVGIKSMLPAEQFYYSRILGEVDGVTTFENFGLPRWENTLCLLTIWFLIYICLANGIKSSGKIVYFTALFPYVGLLSLFINGCRFPGADRGMASYVTPVFHRLADSKVWIDASIQVFYSLGPVWGMIPALASYNNFHSNIIRDSVITVIVDSMTSMLAGLVIFAYLGHLSYKLDVGIEEVASAGPGLAFIMYPTALTLLPGAPVWSCVFFFTLLVLGVGSAFNMTQGTLTAFMDFFPSTRHSWMSRNLTTACICLLFFLPGLVFCTPGADYVLDFMDSCIGGWQLIFMGTMECLVVAWAYGWRRFSNDIGIMVPMFKRLKWPSLLLGLMLGIVTPLITSILMIWQFTNSKSAENRGYTYPSWSYVFAWLLRLIQLSPIVLIAGFHLWRTKCDFKASVKPSALWGPTLPQHRELVTYASDFELSSKIPRMETSNRQDAEDMQPL